MSAPADSSPRPPRLLCVDALRGFDMLWIVGGEQVAHALESTSDNPVTSAVTRQLSHVEWAGCHFFDVIFPLFLFLVGVSIVLSFDRLLAEVGLRRGLLRIAKRSVMLFVVGFIFYEGWSRPWPDVQLMGVLPRIALCYLAAATLYALLPRKGIVLAALACLVGYWALLTYVPFPDVNLKHPTIGKQVSQTQEKPPAVVLAGTTKTTKGTYDEGHNLANYVDYRWLPGRKRNLYYTNEGLLSTIPSIATTLFGIMAGWLVTSKRWTGKQKVAWLLAAGAVGVALGLLWGLEFPVIKRIWTSSFCLVSGGCSAILFGLFYLVIEVWQWNKWCAPFLWIGSNALAIYLADDLLDFQGIAKRFVGGDIQIFLNTHVAQGVGSLVITAVALLLPICLARFLYQRKIFIRL